MDLNSYFFKALRECSNYDVINTHLLQRKLMLSYYQAFKIYKELKKLGIVANEKIETSPLGWVKVGIINKKRLEQLRTSH